MNLEEHINQVEATKEDELELPAKEDYRVLFSQAVHLYESRDFEEAAKLFLEINQKFPDKPEVLLNYGNCQYELFNSDEAVKYWQAAKEKDKYLINAYINLGNYYLANDKYNEAEKEYTFAFCLNPHNELILTNLAITFDKMNNKRRAFLLYEFFLAQNLNVSSNNYKNIQKKVTVHKLNAISHMKIGIYYERKGYYRKAIQSYYDSLRMFPNFAKTYSNIGNIFYKLEKYQQAKEYWLEAYKIDKKNISLYLNLALCCEKLEDYVNAYAFYTGFIQNTKMGSQDFILAEGAAQKLYNIIMSNNEYITNFKALCEEYYNNQKYYDALIFYNNLAVLSKNKEITERINQLQLETNIIHKASFISYEIAKDLFEQGRYEFAMEKCKLSSNLWKNSYFEQNLLNLLNKCQNELGNTLSNFLKARH